MREYVERKYSQSGEYISSHEEEGSRRILFSPQVFKVPKEQMNQNLIAVMMPFESSFNNVYETIKTAAQLVNLECKRADDIWSDSSIIQDVFSLIFQSYIVVCDFTSKNANVFYEAGIAHTLGKHVVPITQSAGDIPFDLRHHRFACYLNNGEGLEVLRVNLMERFQTLIGLSNGK